VKRLKPLAPNFQLPDQHGKLFDLDEILKVSPAVLFFYPKDETPGCTKEVCSFRDSFAEFQKAGFAVVGISGDSIRAHEKFAWKHRLPYRLLSDKGGEVAARFGVKRKLGIIPGRVTLVIGQDRNIYHRFEGLFMADEHVRQALGALGLRE
jgi:thioredoxin-dependent peroxiredoxin